MVKNVEERIARIKQQREALAQRLNTLEQKAASEARKRDTRRKIIVGGAIIAQMEKVAGFAGLSFAHFSRHPSGVKMTARPSPICSTPPPALPARRLLKKAAALSAPVPRENTSGVNSARPDALSPSPPPQAPRAFSPLFTARPIPQEPPADPLASDIDNLSRLLGRKSE